MVVTEQRASMVKNELVKVRCQRERQVSVQTA
jgi:hypothetical protein